MRVRPSPALLPVACTLGALLALAGGARAQRDPVPPASSLAPSGHAPIASGVPLGWLPPGATVPDAGPSQVIYPPQQIPLRFDHRLHNDRAGLAMACTDCHTTARTSTAASDRLLPSPGVCDRCHGSDHRDLLAVKAGPDAKGACVACHTGYRPEDGNTVARVVIPTPHLRSNHRAHADRAIGCESCHGAVQAMGMATREQMPRMKGCFGCHALANPGRGDARAECVTCHEPLPDGRIVASYPEGKLMPPRWLGNLQHTADFLERHKRVAADNSRACGACHTESYCADCHDGRVRPRSVHPNDYLSLHAVESRLEASRCTSCHQEQQFCLPCHQRAGVAQTAGPGSNRQQGRFHPPRTIWSELPRTRQHHAWEAMRNLNACVGCHTERDCTVCHATQAAGGRGFDPHPAGFASRCAAAARKNPRPCLVCHEGTDPRSLCR